MGTKKLKKLLIEAKVPASRRAQTPVVVDAEGEVLWVPGLARTARSRRIEPSDLRIGVG